MVRQSMVKYVLMCCFVTIRSRCFTARGIPRQRDPGRQDNSLFFFHTTLSILQISSAVFCSLSLLLSLSHYLFMQKKGKEKKGKENKGKKRTLLFDADKFHQL